ncbi:unnamed protein product [Callosobruchus maculatus]|uniref:Uncharacterized protein n=1 Tax=Callosobruchus maculatus TaxID=64391 RepID=A0A653BXG2_CALMS|nr:unnamed protein product [Callosobruchus maculatus]
MQSAEELDIKTEIRTSPSFMGVDIKNEIDTNEQIDRIKCENEDYNDSPVIPDRFIKTEQDELETYVDEACYIDTVQLNEELKIKNEICADQESSYPDLMRASSAICTEIVPLRIKTEHNTEEWNECPATQLHTEFDVKREMSWKRKKRVLNLV